jgi:peptidoglycan/LPS O-acetylase OafA/YrhL
MGQTSILSVSERKRLDQLDGLRGLCALAVLAAHLIYGPYWSTGNNLEFSPAYFLRIIASFSHLAVLIFFVLSGFVIGYTTPEKFTWTKARNYILKRLIRLYPIYLVAILLSCAVAEKTPGIIDVVGHLLFLQGWLVPVLKENLSLWSLQYEFMFYLLFIVIWKLNIEVSKAIAVCFLFAFLSSIFDFYLFKLLGYFTIWLSGLWLSRNMSSLKLINKHSEAERFWTSIILIAAFESQNIFDMAINKYGVPSERPPIICDVILLGLLNSIVAATIGYKFPGYTLSFVVTFLSTLSAVGYSLYKGTIHSLSGYELASFFLLLLPFTFLFKRLPINSLMKLTGIGSLSYALYVLHFPLQIFIYRQVSPESTLAIVYFWVASSVIATLSFAGAWFLECYLHPKIASKLRAKFGLSAITHK